MLIQNWKKENDNNNNNEKENNNSKLINENQLNKALYNLENKFQNNINRMEENLI